MHSFSFFILFDVRYLEISLDTCFIYLFFFFIPSYLKNITSLRVGYDDPYIYIYVYHVYIVSIYRAKNIKQISIFPIRKKLREIIRD